MKNFVGFLGYEKTRLFAFEIYWPLVQAKAIQAAIWAVKKWYTYTTRLGFHQDTYYNSLHSAELFFCQAYWDWTFYNIFIEVTLTT